MAQLTMHSSPQPHTGVVAGCWLLRHSVTVRRGSFWATHDCLAPSSSSPSMLWECSLRSLVGRIVRQDSCNTCNTQCYFSLGCNLPLVHRQRQVRCAQAWFTGAALLPFCCPSSLRLAELVALLLYLLRYTRLQSPTSSLIPKS